MASELEDDLSLALDLALAASELALPLFRAGVAARHKPDGSLVTDADLAVERRLFALLAERRPGDAVLSEESGAHGAAERRWIFDPIDGTSNFAAGQETWGTHVALEVAGELVLGVVTRPVAGEWWWAARGAGAFHGPLGSRAPGERLRVAGAADAGRARLMVWADPADPLVLELQRQERWLAPSLDAVLLLASGRIDAVVDHLSHAWDFAPGVVIVEEAGGRFADVDGGRRLDAGGAWFTNGRLDGSLCAFDAALRSGGGAR